MKAIRLIAFCAIAASLCACSKNGTAPGKAGEVRFSASVGSFAFTRATESALENNDKVRIIAGAPINASAVGTVDGTSLTLDSPIYWKEGQTESTTFCAIYNKDDVAAVSPTVEYNLLYEGNHAYEYHKLYMTATRTAAPESPVAFEFRHPFSKITIGITNNLVNNAVTKVEIKQLVMEGSLSIAEGTIALSESKVNFEATKLDDNSYAAIVMPQTGTPSIVVTVANGTAYTFVLASAFTFQAGYAYNAALTLSQSVTPPQGDAVAFSFTVIPWQDGGDLGYTLSDSYTPSWGVIGKLNGVTDWENDAVFLTQTSEGTQAQEGIWEGNITYAPGDEFKLRWNKAWDIQAGMSTAEGVHYAVAGENSLWGSNNTNIVLGSAYDEVNGVTPLEAGSYHLRFVYDGYILTVTKN